MARSGVKIDVSGLNELCKQLEALGGNSHKIMSEVVLAGTNVVTDTLRERTAALKVTTGRTKGKRYCTPNEKQGLLDSLGYTPEGERGGKLNRKAGFDGYNKTKTKKWPKGQPNPMIANFINSGTTYMTAQPFISNTARQSKAQTVAEMEKRLAEEIAKYGV